MLRRLVKNLLRNAPAPLETGASQALAFLEAGDVDRAEPAALAALHADPGSAPAHFALGRVALARGDLGRARESFEHALRIDPEFDAARAELAALAQREGRLDEAIGHYRAGLARHRHSSKLLHALGAALAERRDFGEAVVALRRALEIAPDLAPAREALSRALFNARRFGEAEAVERALLAREPDAPRLHLRLAHALLAQGRLDEGWDEYEWRLRQPGFAWGVRGLRRWDGVDPAGRTILVIAEQGLGDAILFARFVPELARRGARVRLLCQPQLERLFRSSLGTESIAVSADAAGDISDVDACVHLLSLPRTLGLGASAVARRSRYLRPDAALVDAWQRRIADLPHPRIGLVWAGNPERSGDECRSLPPETVAPLGAARPDASWICLQAGLPVAAPRPFPMADWMGSVADFADTAALISALDLVIAVDTSVAHAAGAVGTPLWLLAPHNVCWRWMMDETQSPWYPDVRLFQALGPEGWRPVIDSVASSLRALPAPAP